MKILYAFVLVFLFATPYISIADTPVVGQWRTVDDVTGEVKAIVEITESDGELSGVIKKLFNKDPFYDPLCDQCKDELNGEKIIGMQIINDLGFQEGKWHGKKGILDPENGRYYNCKIWIDKDDPDILHVRGYFLICFYRTQTWYREK